MTNLTEQWKNGELESGWYYVNFYSVGAVMQEYLPEHNGFGYDEKNLIQEVLAPVPSYEEWQKLTAWNKEYKIREKNYGESYEALFNEKEKLKNELGLLKESIGKDCGTYYINLFLQENQQLKELLKECRPYFDALVEKRLKLEYIPQVYKLLTKIDNAIGERSE